jgi:threonine synthase
MDILISSNLERLIFTLTGNDPEKTAAFMRELAEKKRYQIDEEMLNRLQAVYACGYADEVALKAEIWKRWHDQHYLMDTHTAVASAVLREYVEKTGDTRKNVIVSTASPYKLGPAVLSAIGGLDVETMDDFECCVKLSALTGTKEPEVIKKLPGTPVRHDQTCAKDKMPEALLEALKRSAERLE